MKKYESPELLLNPYILNTHLATDISLGDNENGVDGGVNGENGGIDW